MIEAPSPCVCPQCKGALEASPDDYRCRSCGRRYPVVMGIPDFRLFPDPYISIAEDYWKARALAQDAEELSFGELVARYWQMTPGVPNELVREYVRSALDGYERSQQTLKLVESIGGPVGRGLVLDVGCGTAGFLTAAAPMFERGVGIDIAFRWLIVAKKRLQEMGISNVTLLCGCAEHLPFPDSVFDLVVAEDVLDHVRNQQAMVHESARVLAPRTGRFYLSTPNRYSLGPDPHVWVWGVGFVPRRFRDRYVRWRRGVAYGPIRIVSYLHLRQLLRRAPLIGHRVLFPELRGLERRTLSRWQRAQAQVYGLIRRIRVFRPALYLFGPSFQVVCRRNDGR